MTDKMRALPARWRLRAMELEKCKVKLSASMLRECAEEVDAMLDGREPNRTSWFEADSPPADLRARARWHEQQAADCWKKIGGAR